MKSRPSLDRDLVSLRDNVLRLGQLADVAVQQAMRALKENDVELARQVRRDDEQLNIMRYQIEDDSYTLMALRQPTARDMRTVMTAVHIAVELERIGDYADGICKLLLRLYEGPAPHLSPQLFRMAARARQMIHSSLDAYVNGDITLAHQTKQSDDEVDDLWDIVHQEIIVQMQNDPATIPRATYMLWIAHNLERIADRATNICERVIYMVTGQVRSRLQKVPEELRDEEQHTDD